MKRTNPDVERWPVRHTDIYVLNGPLMDLICGKWFAGESASGKVRSQPQTATHSEPRADQAYRMKLWKEELKTGFTYR